MSTFKVKRNAELRHHGILGMKWGDRNGPPYPLDSPSHSASEVIAGWRKSLKAGKAAKTAKKAVKTSTKAVGGGGGETDEERYKRINESFDWSKYKIGDLDKKMIMKVTDNDSISGLQALQAELNKRGLQDLAKDIETLYTDKHPDKKSALRVNSALNDAKNAGQEALDSAKNDRSDTKETTVKAEEKKAVSDFKIKKHGETEEEKEEKEEEKKSSTGSSRGSSSKGSSGSSKGSAEETSTEEEEEESPSEIAQFLNDWAKKSGTKLLKDLSDEKKDVADVIREWAKTDGAKLIAEITNSKNSKDVAKGLLSWAKGEGGKLIAELGKDKSDVQGLLQKWASNLGDKFVDDLTFTASISSIANILSSWAESEGEEFVTNLSDKKSDKFSSTIRSWANDVGSTLIDELKDSDNISAVSDFMKEWF